MAQPTIKNEKINKLHFYFNLISTWYVWSEKSQLYSLVFVYQLWICICICLYTIAIKQEHEPIVCVKMSQLIFVFKIRLALNDNKVHFVLISLLLQTVTIIWKRKKHRATRKVLDKLLFSHLISVVRVESYYNKKLLLFL